MNGKLLSKRPIPCVEASCVEASCVSWSPISSTSCEEALSNVTLLERVRSFVFRLPISSVKV